jgi:hypothetical protein
VEGRLIFSDDTDGHGRYKPRRDRRALEAGLGYAPSQTWYFALSYFIQDGYYTVDTPIQSATAEATWQDSAHWSMTFSYTRGMAGAVYDDYFSMQVGYEF